MASATSRIKIAGTWTGVLEIELENWSVSMLRREVASRSNLTPDAIKLISGGRVLKDADWNLSELGLKDNSKVLSTRASSREGQSLNVELMAMEERNNKLARIKCAAASLAKRHAYGLLGDDDFDLMLEDQNGRPLHFPEGDRKAIMACLMLHAFGKQLMSKEMYGDALEVLTMGEESCSLCNPKFIDLVDNIPLLQIDIVWCYFMLQDISWLSMAGARLEKAREGLETAHGKDVARFRLLQAGSSSDLTVYLRLELLEAVVAYHSGKYQKCNILLTSAQAKLSKLQVSDESLSALMNLGFKEKEAKRALRASDQSVVAAVNLLVEEQAKKDQKEEENLRRRDEILEQRKYGKTPSKKGVDLAMLKNLETLEYAKEVAAEALRRNENDFQKALDDLTSPQANAAIQASLESRKRARQNDPVDFVEDLVSMGFERSKVMEALEGEPGSDSTASFEEVMERLGANPASPEGLVSGGSSSHGEEASSSSSGGGGKRDVDMEEAITAELAGKDFLSDYDIDIPKVGDAIAKYFSLLEAANSGSQDPK